MFLRTGGGGGRLGLVGGRLLLTTRPPPGGGVPGSHTTHHPPYICCILQTPLSPTTTVTVTVTVTVAVAAILHPIRHQVLHQHVAEKGPASKFCSFGPNLIGCICLLQFCMYVSMYVLSDISRCTVIPHGTTSTNPGLDRMHDIAAHSH